MYTNDFYQDVQTRLNQAKYQYAQINEAELTKNFTPEEIAQIHTKIQQMLHKDRIDFSKSLRAYKRDRAAEILKAANSGIFSISLRTKLTDSEQQQIATEVQGLRAIYKEMEKYLPRCCLLASVRSYKNMQHKKQEQERLTAQEEEMLNRPLTIEDKMCIIFLSPVVVPVFAFLIGREAYLKTPYAQAQQKKKLQQSAAKAKAEQEKMAAEKSKRFRKLWRQMHQR